MMLEWILANSNHIDETGDRYPGALTTSPLWNKLLFIRQTVGTYEPENILTACLEKLYDEISTSYTSASLTMRSNASTSQTGQQSGYSVVNRFHSSAMPLSVTRKRSLNSDVTSSRPSGVPPSARKQSFNRVPETDDDEFPAGESNRFDEREED